MKSFRVIIFSSSTPRTVWRLAQRIEREVPEARVCGVLYELRRGATFTRRLRRFLRGLRDPGFLSYALSRMAKAANEWAMRLGHRLLCLAHACPPNPNGLLDLTLEEFVRRSGAAGCPVLVTADMHSSEALEFVRRQAPDVGIVYGTRILKQELFALPRFGSLNIHKRKLPEYRGGGPVGLWELLEGQTEIGVTVHRLEESLDAGSVVRSTALRIDPYDTLGSLGLKTDLVGNDLLIQAVADFARGTVNEQPQEGPSRMYKTPPPHVLRRYTKQIERLRPPRPSFRSARLWKMCLGAFLLGPFLIARNWYRRGRGSAPVWVLFHHLVSDRPHHLGMPTATFLRVVEFLRKHYRIVSLTEAIELLQTGNVKVPTIVLTFDDGYQENFVNLRAVMEATGIAVALFVCTGLVDEQREWQHDLTRGQRNFLPLTWEQLAYFRANGAEIGSHTRSHFDCGARHQDVLATEIVGSKKELEQHLGHPVRFFAFPWGKPKNMSEEAVALARSNYSYFFSAYGGENFPGGLNSDGHLQRKFLPEDLWELELTLQSVFDLSLDLRKIFFHRWHSAPRPKNSGENSH